MDVSKRKLVLGRVKNIVGKRENPFNCQVNKSQDRVEEH